MQTKAERFFESLRGKKVAFIGAGVSHRQLLPMFAAAGASVTLCDRRETADGSGELGKAGIRLSLGEQYLDGLKGQDMILRTPGFGYFTPELQAAKEAGSLVTSETELFLELCPCKTIGITGSDGKTTTSTLIAEMLRAEGRTVHLGGNIGRALLPEVGAIRPGDVTVVELSSFQLISMQTSPDTAVVTNVTPNHLDHHRDMREYIDAKRNILLHQTARSRAVLGYENGITRAMRDDVAGSLYWFSRLNRVGRGAFLAENGDLCFADGGLPVPVVNRSAVKLRGDHNIENLLAAIAAAAGDVSFEKMARVASDFAGVEHRIEPVRTIGGVQWFNDSIATSPTRTIAGLRSFREKLILIAGGSDKHLDYAPLAPEIAAHVRCLILTGATGRAIEETVRGCPSFDPASLTILHADSLEDAVRLAAEQAKSGDIVLLSPASASFDSFPNFEARGERFKDLVRAL